MSVSHNAFKAVRGAIEMGLIVHASHPDFGGSLTIGMSHHLHKYEIIGHGTSVDLDYVGTSVQDAVRYYVNQVGKRNALAGALETLKRASGE